MSRHHFYAQVAAPPIKLKNIWIIGVVGGFAWALARKINNHQPDILVWKTWSQLYHTSTELRRWLLSESIVDYSKIVDDIEYHISKFECDSLNLLPIASSLSTDRVNIEQYEILSKKKSHLTAWWSIHCYFMKKKQKKFLWSCVLLTRNQFNNITRNKHIPLPISNKFNRSIYPIDIFISYVRCNVPRHTSHT